MSAFEWNFHELKVIYMREYNLELLLHYEDGECYETNLSELLSFKRNIDGVNLSLANLENEVPGGHAFKERKDMKRRINI
jgi:hypothetical protein